MSDLEARMAAIIDGVIGDDCEHYGLEEDPNTPGGCKPCHEYAKRIAERLMPVVTEAQAATWDASVATALNHAILNEDGITLRLEHLDGRPWANPHRSNDE